MAFSLSPTARSHPRRTSELSWVTPRSLPRSRDKKVRCALSYMQLEDSPDLVRDSWTNRRVRTHFAAARDHGRAPHWDDHQAHVGGEHSVARRSLQPVPRWSEPDARCYGRFGHHPGAARLTGQLALGRVQEAHASRHSSRPRLRHHFECKDTPRFSSISY